MPGPGGGGRGGGGGGRGGSFGGGGGFGGGGRGGSLGGGHRPGGLGGLGGFHYRPHGPRFHIWGPGFGFRRPYYGGGGCLGGMLGAIIAPIFVLMFLFVWFGSMAGSCSYVEVETNETPAYSADAIGDYADEQYAAAFGLTDDYEDHMLLVFLTEPECYDYYYIAWVGDHVKEDVAELLGNNQTALGRALGASVNAQSYEYSLDRDLAKVFSHLADQITSLALDGNHSCGTPDNSVNSHVVNRTTLPLSEQTLNEALEDFTQKTGISTVVVVEDMSDVLGNQEQGSASSTFPLRFSGGTLFLIAVVAILLVVLITRSRKGAPTGQSGKWE